MSEISVTSTGATGGISVDTSRLASKDNLKKAGDKFEAVFDGMMLKAMRQAQLSNPLFDSKAIDTFTEMQDAQVAQSMAEHAPMGIGKAMTDFLAKSQANTPQSANSQSDINPDSAQSTP
ncbi:rod-binding protein [Sphingomonas sp. PB2P19]|uniref:rod-binding protein n=1 Tax=Sphingomonas rhamnosi TaxID=3096156 RepID=UPI002FC81B91